MDIISSLESDEEKSKDSFFKIVSEIFSDKNIQTKTDLSQEEIFHYSFLHYLGNSLKWDGLKRYVKDVLTFKLSKQRKSRTEFLDGIKNYDNTEAKQHKDDFITKLLR